MIEAGLDGAIIDPTEPRMMATVAAARGASRRDEYCMKYIRPPGWKAIEARPSDVAPHRSRLEVHMLCQRCKKKQATVHMTEIEGGEKKEVHLCEDCSQRRRRDHQGPGVARGFPRGAYQGARVAQGIQARGHQVPRVRDQLRRVPVQGPLRLRRATTTCSAGSWSRWSEKIHGGDGARRQGPASRAPRPTPCACGL